MNKHIKIYKVNGKFCFTVDKFSSIRHSSFTKFSSQWYRYAWEAYDDAKRLAEKHTYHLDALEKFAIEDFSKLVVDEVSAETKLSHHYSEVYDGLVETANGMLENDKRQKKVNYFEAKAVVQEILFVIDKISEDEIAEEKDKEKSKVKLKGILSDIKNLVNKYYKDELSKDKKENKEEESPMGEMEAPIEDPMGGSAPEMGGAPMEMPMASSKLFTKIAKLDEIDVDSEAVKNLLDEYGKKACSAIENKHPNAIWKKESNNVNIVDGKDIIVSLNIGDDLFLNDVIPGEKIDDMYPCHSLEFYQAYWKPIVEKVGHCCVGDNTHILHLGNKCLPDIPKEFPYESKQFTTINKNSKSPSTFVVSFKGENKPSWFVKEFPMAKIASAKYSKEQYYQNGKGAIVVCIDPTLKSYYKNTGHVIQVIPFGEHLEVDIKWKLEEFDTHICRMTEDQFDILDGI